MYHLQHQLIQQNDAKVKIKQGLSYPIIFGSFSMVVFDINKTLGDASGQHPFIFPRFGPCVGTKTQNVPGNGAGAGPAGPAGPAPRTARRARATAGAKRRYL